MNQNIIIETKDISGYKLLDSGEGEKLEKVGDFLIVRSEPRAWWKKQNKESWKNVDAVFKKSETSKNSSWKFNNKNIQKDFVIETGLGKIKSLIQFTSNSKHIGIFPEQAVEWEWVDSKIKDLRPARLDSDPPDMLVRQAGSVSGGLKIKNTDKNRETKVLNLFGYTGIASLVAAQAGAEVTHLDASKQAVEWARKNQKLSGLEDAPIRWICEDVLKFMSKEIKKGEKYDAIIMDPPSFGHGPNGEKWKIEEKLPELLKLCSQILSDAPLFILFNMYSTELSSISLTLGFDFRLRVGYLLDTCDDFQSSLQICCFIFLIL
jgi:23S rRNA (cytosine1962-C5)-methyltransferase